MANISISLKKNVLTAKGHSSIGSATSLLPLCWTVLVTSNELFGLHSSLDPLLLATADCTATVLDFNYHL